MYVLRSSIHIAVTRLAMYVLTVHAIQRFLVCYNRWMRIQVGAVLQNRRNYPLFHRTSTSAENSQVFKEMIH